MTDNLMVFCTCETETEGQRIGALLVAERLAACVTILPAVHSIYRWKELVENTSETLLLIKSTETRWSALRDRIISLHSYETPEIVAIPIALGSEKYLAWLREQV